MNKQPPRTQNFRVAAAGENDWVDIRAVGAAQAGAIWAEDRGPYSVSETLELDVEDSGGGLLAVTVEISVSVGYDAVATKHPSQP